MGKNNSQDKQFYYGIGAIIAIVLIVSVTLQLSGTAPGSSQTVGDGVGKSDGFAGLPIKEPERDDGEYVIEDCHDLIRGDQDEVVHAILENDLDCSAGYEIMPNEPIRIPAVSIRGSNVILDCQDHTITGFFDERDDRGWQNEETEVIGVEISNRGEVSENVIIKNCNIHGFNTGIKLEDTNKSNASSNTLMRNIIGIGLGNSHENTIELNTISNNYKYGIHLGGLLNIISNNRVINNEMHGISIINSDENRIVENTVTENGYEGIALSNSNLNEIAHNIISSNGQEGILISARGNSNIIRENTIENNGDGLSLIGTMGGGDREENRRVRDNTIENNNICYNQNDIVCRDSFAENSFSNNKFDGLVLDDCYELELEENPCDQIEEQAPPRIPLVPNLPNGNPIIYTGNAPENINVALVNVLPMIIWVSEKGTGDVFIPILGVDGIGEIQPGMEYKIDVMGPAELQGNWNLAP